MYIYTKIYIHIYTILKRGNQKNECPGDLKSSCHGYLPEGVGVTMFLVKKVFFKKNMAWICQLQMLILGCFSQSAS